MTPQHPLSTRLREARVAKNISVSELQAKARIREHLIVAIDDGRFDELPAVYMRSFLRRYAECVGVPSQEIDDLILRHLDSDLSSGGKGSSRPFSLFPSAKSAGPKRLSLEGTNNRRRILIILVSIFGVACLSGIYLLLRGPSDGTLSTERQSLLRGVDSLLAPSEQAGKLMNYFGVTPQDSISLEAVCTDTVWINITVDRKTTDIVTLNPGQQRTWSGAESFVLSVRNAGGVTFKRNGMELPRIGKIGETVRSIRITRTEFITSASPWRSQRDTSKNKPSPKSTAPMRAPAPSPVKPALQKPTTSMQLTQKNPPTVSAVKRNPARPSPGALPSKPLSTPLAAQQPPMRNAPTSPQKPQINAAVASPQGTRANPAVPAKKNITTPLRQQAKVLPVRVESAKERERRLRLERIRREAKKRDLTPVIIR